jgi:hypothetical protein
VAKRSLHEQQNSMGLYLRDPERCAPPAEMDPARAQVYRDLVFANLSSLISGTFPVLVNILGDDQWRALVRAFLRDYRAHTPKFGEIAEEFVEFLASAASVGRGFLAAIHGGAGALRMGRNGAATIRGRAFAGQRCRRVAEPPVARLATGLAVGL